MELLLAQLKPALVRPELLELLVPELELRLVQSEPPLQEPE